ncbi:MAG: ATP-binding cassette domain-containing protein [Alphaproteobacteria bacterium]|nr:ATP-binding cassette domain-containing protein [Alphaproteobacteria bacterium]
MAMISVEGLNFDYPGSRVLHDVSFTIAEGSVTAMVGPNGAGKTTLLRCIAGLEHPHSGRVAIGGTDVAEDPRRVHRMTGYLSDFFGLYEGLTVRQCLTHMAWCHNLPAEDVGPRVEALLAETGIAHMQDKKAAALSRGYRQRLGIGLALVHDPALIILDEPASGMDPEARIALSQHIRLLRKRGKTMVISSHILNELEDYCTDMLVIQHGRVAQHLRLSEFAARPTRILRIGVLGLGVAHLDKLMAQPMLTVVTQEGDFADCEYTGTLQDQQKMLQALLAQGVPVFSLSASGHTLQDAYMTATGAKSDKGGGGS